MQLIALTGRSKAGKDTVAKMIKVFGGSIHTTAFADRLKTICSMVYGVPIRYFYDEKLKELPLNPWGLSPRNMMTMTQDDLKAKHGDDFFTKVVAQEHTKLSSLPEGLSPKFMLVTDLRFTVEADWVKEVGGKIVRVSNLDADTVVGNVHLSEKGLPESYIDHTISNNGDMLSLFAKVDALVDKYGLNAK